MALLRVLVVSAVLIVPSGATAASLQEITNFGANPSSIRMFLYVPGNVASHPAIVVGIHWCHGDGPAFYSGTQFAALADRYGFVVVYPSAISSDGCWDVHSPAALTHDGGSDPSGIVSMVKYVEQNYNGDANRVYATGQSSGAMMTNVLLGSYPDVFKAGAPFAGVPFSCFAGANSWSTDCATGKITKTAQQWGDAVRAAYPGYTGPRPRMQLWHGTADATLDFHNFGEEIKQWTDVLQTSQTPTSTEANTPQPTWTRDRYADACGSVQVEAIVEQGQPHNLQILGDQAIHFFGLDGTGPAPDGGCSQGGSPAGDGGRPSAVDASSTDAFAGGGTGVDGGRSTSADGSSSGSPTSSGGDASQSASGGSGGGAGTNRDAQAGSEADGSVGVVGAGDAAVGRTPEVDANAGSPSAGASVEASKVDRPSSGCSCDTAGRSPGDGWILGLVTAGALLVMRRRG